MLTLQKIEAHAAQRLRLPAGTPPAGELARYKNFLKVESHRLKILHRGGAGGREVCQARAALLDVLLRHILQGVIATLPAGDKKRPAFALVAIGGYGRGELNPHSDIDIMFLHDGELTARGKQHPFLAALTGEGGLLYTLYDIGLKVGHSVRSVDDCVKVANSDMQSRTSLIEARLITGDESLFAKMQKVVLAKCVKGHESAYIAARIADQEARRAKFGNSACMQEPNIKNGCGGLRDFQNLLWMAFFKYRARTVADMQKADLMTASEAKQLEAAYDYLLRVRTELHYHLNRAVDTVTRNVQAAIAYNLGYTDRSPRQRLEQFMRELYTHARAIYLITRMLEQRLALLPQPARLPSFRDILRTRRQRATEVLVDGLRFFDGEIQATAPRIFREQPRRLMRVFLHAQQRGLKLHPDLAQLIRNELSLVNRSFLADEHVHQTFLEILNQRGNVGPILRAMHDVDFLGKYLPEFGRLTCLVQHEFYHQYAADEHTLVCIDKLDQIWEAKEAPFSKYADMFQSVERPFVLYLAVLLHDAGKAGGEGNHSEAGAKIAVRVARRLGLDSAATFTLRLVIEQHLTMVQISQRRDLDDPAVIRTFAGQVKTPENLIFLTLHTFADSMGTSAKLWNEFKDSLLWTLHQKTLQMFGGDSELLHAEEEQREMLMREVRRLLPASLTEEELQAHFAHLPERYFAIHPPRGIIADLALVHRFMHLQISEEDRALEPVVAWHNEPDRGYTSVKICTWDRVGLFSKIAGSLTAAGLNILSAQIFSRSDGIILDTLFVNDAVTGKTANRDEKEKFEELLLQALKQEVDFSDLLRRRKSRAPLYQGIEFERLPTRIEFDNDTSERCTVIDIETEDRVGLLYYISQTLSELDLDISVAKISTEKGAAIDSFYVSEQDSSKIESAERKKQVERKLRGMFNKLEKQS